MKYKIKYVLLFLFLSCNSTIDSKKLNLIIDNQWIGDGIAYGPFRDGQMPGGLNPTKQELKEDLRIINQHWNWIRLYGSRGVTEEIIQIILEENLSIKIMLGAWIGKVDSYEGISNNIAELKQSIYLANKYPNVINSLNIGNETLVFWSDHKIPVDTLEHYISFIKKNVNVPVTTADDFNAWNKSENKVISELSDFIVLHIHPLWGGLLLNKSIDWVKKIYYDIKTIYPKKLIVIGETGWATQKHNKGIQAELIKGKTGESEQMQFIKELRVWVDREKIPYFLFEAFDEKWKGGEHPDEVEKHWGLYNSDRSPKEYMKYQINR